MIYLMIYDLRHWGYLHLIHLPKCWRRLRHQGPRWGREARTMVSVLTRVEDYLHSEIKRGMIKERRERGPTASGGVWELGGGSAGAPRVGARYANNGEIMYRLQWAMRPARLRCLASLVDITPPVSTSRSHTYYWTLLTRQWIFQVIRIHPTRLRLLLRPCPYKSPHKTD